MLSSKGRTALAFLSAATFATLPAHAVVVRGRLTDATGHPVTNGRVNLIQNKLTIATAFADDKGNYELRSAASGRFTLVGVGNGYLPYFGKDFYARATDVLEQDVALSTTTVRQEVSVTATGIPTPLPQLTAPVSVLEEEAFNTRLGVVDEMRQTPGAFLVQQGQTGTVASLFMRGGNSTANLVLIDSIPADDVGGTFDFGTVSSTGIGRMELYRGPNSAMYGTDAGSSVITLDTPRGSTLRPTINYSGDAGNLHTWRNEVTAGGAFRALDYFGAFSRLDTSNALRADRYHSVTSAGNIGYAINGNTSLRFTIRNADSVGGLPGAYDFQGLTTNGSQQDQDLYSGFTLENRYHENWHNLLRYGIARKREQAQQGQIVGTDLGFGEYVGNNVTIRGANGYTVTGQAQVYGGNSYDQDFNRDQLYYQSDYTASKHFIALFGFRYDNERGSYNDYYSFAGYTAAPTHEVVQRTNFEYNLQFQGSFWNRLFYSAGGAVEKNHLYGIEGTPKVGLTYIPVRSSNGFFHGTRLRANYATGVQEPTLALENSSLYDELLKNGYTSTIAALKIGRPGAEKSKTWDFGIDQNIFGEKFVLKAGYFHNMFDHQLEGVSGQGLIQYFPGYAALPPALLSNPYFEAYVNSLAFRAQGAEAEVSWQAFPSLFIRGGYTYLAARVVQSFTSDQIATGTSAFLNNNLPNVAIGAYGPLKGGRPFRRPPNSGYFSMVYTKRKLTLAMQGAMASRSDDSTFLYQSDASYDNTLLLPNRDLDFGYVKLDLKGSYAAKHGLTYFVQFDNLLNNQHIGPIGYPGLPMTFRAGVKARLFGGQ